MMIVCKYRRRQFRFWLARNIVRFGWMICPQPEKMLMQYIWDEGVKSTEERNQCKPH